MYLAFGKRYFDVLIGILLSILFSWVFVFILLIYILSFQYPFFFLQQRIGYQGRPFTMIKFRTLNADANLSLLQRRFWLGNALRFFSLDELPQLLNVLRGDMSMVGPRPLPVEYRSLMNEKQQRRHSLRPGITGLTQINRGRHQISWQKKFDLDVKYVDHVSFFLDMTVIIKTIFLLLTPKQDVSLNEEKFKGN